MSVVAGVGTYCFSGDGGQATAAQLVSAVGVGGTTTGVIYICDTLLPYNARVRKVTTDGIITTTVGMGIPGLLGDCGPATSATLCGYYLAVDSVANLYLTEFNGNRIRKVDASTQIISNFAGGGSNVCEGSQATSATLTQPVSIFVDGVGKVFWTSANVHKVRVIGTDG